MIWLLMGYLKIRDLRFETKIEMKTTTELLYTIFNLFCYCAKGWDKGLVLW